VLQCVAVCCSVLQCVAVCCSVLQCVAVCCNQVPNLCYCFFVHLQESLSNTLSNKNDLFYQIATIIYKTKRNCKISCFCMRHCHSVSLNERGGARGLRGEKTRVRNGEECALAQEIEM